MGNKKILIAFYAICGFLVWGIFRRLTLTAISLLQVNRKFGVTVHEAIYVLVPLIVAIGGFIFVWNNAKVNSFMDEVVSETAKVTWPTKKETVPATVVVIITVIICGIILGIFDFAWSRLANYVLGS